MDQLRQNYAFNKKIPADLERDILLALSHYPELSKVKITFCYKNLFTSMKAVPLWTFFFHKQSNRVYRIVMNKKTCHGKTIVQRITPSAFDGVVGHELGHIVDYSKHSNWGLTKLLFHYLFVKGRIAIENTADEITIEHGFGSQLIEFDKLLLQDSCINPSYLKYKKKYYNSPDQLTNLMNHWQKTKATSEPE